MPSDSTFAKALEMDNIHCLICISEASAQYKQNFTGLTRSFLKLVLNGSDKDLSLLAQMLLKHIAKNTPKWKNL